MPVSDTGEQALKLLLRHFALDTEHILATLVINRNVLDG